MLMHNEYQRHLSSGSTTVGSDGCPEVVSETGEPLFGSLIDIDFPKLLIISVILTICFVKLVVRFFLYIELDVSLIHSVI